MKMNNFETAVRLWEEFVDFCDLHDFNIGVIRDVSEANKTGSD